MKSLSLANKVALVTGAGGAIGRAVSLKLAQYDAKIIVTDYTIETGEQTADLIRDAGGEAIFVQADVSSAQDLLNCIETAKAKFGDRIDILVNNAGWEGLVAPVVDYPDDVFDKIMAINVRGVFLGMKHVLPLMIENGYGRIVNLASIAAYVGTRNLAPYTASKHAVLGLTKATAHEVARKGIRINAVCPGPVDTPLLREIEKGQSNGDLDALRKRRTAWIPEGRYAECEEIADLILYLVSDLSNHITGQGIQINGGANS